MQLTLILSGTALLILAGLVHGYRRQNSASQGHSAIMAGRSMRVMLGLRKTQAALRKAAKAAADDPQAAAFASFATELLQALHHLRKQWKKAPRIPLRRKDGERLSSLAKAAAEQGLSSPGELVRLLHANEHAAFSPTEIALFPLLVAFSEAERLYSALSAFTHNQRAAGRRTSTAAEETLPVCESLRHAAECFRAMRRMNWLVHGEEADEIHRLLLTDPAGIYPHMTPDSRFDLRRRAEEFSAHAGVSSASAVQAALSLCREAKAPALEAHAGYWFQDAKGLGRLHHRLNARRGWLYTWFAERQELLRYIILWLAGAAGGFLFLQAGNPVFVLPAFALCSGSILRRFVPPLAARRLPAMDVHDIPSELRTLVVLPTVLHDPQEAIAAVRRMKTARQAFPQSGVDLLLLGDFGDHMTAVSSQDAAVIQTGIEAIHALEDSACLYLQRSRAWDAARHTYGARGGTQGAVREICRLIVQGECADVIAFSSVQAAHFERRYAYVLILPERGVLLPGVLEKLLSVMTHPLNTRYPEGETWRGYAVLSPDECSTYHGFGLLRPDAFLEATDGMTDPQLESAMLCGELAGHTAVAGAGISAPQESNQWNAVFRRSVQSWRLLPWQLAWVRTPMGIIRNPLRFFGRFHLRENIRRTLVPAARCLLLLWAILTQSWPLLLLAVAATNAVLPRSLEELIQSICRLSLLPAEAAVSISGAVDAFRQKGTGEPTWVNLEVWTQGISAAVLAAVGIGIPGMAVPALGFAVLFACFPLAHRFQDTPLRSSVGLTDVQRSLLEHAAASTWHYFETLCADESQPLPSCAVQYEPPLGADKAVTPASIGGCLLAFVCAQDLGMISANQAAFGIERITSALGALAMPFGLPCRSYALPELRILDARVDSAETGFLLAALLTVAQAFRTWLPELDARHTGLSRSVQTIAEGLDILRLYDSDAQLFHTGLDEAGQGVGHVECLTDAAMLLSVAARARRKIPPEHFGALDFTCVRLDGKTLPLSRTGSAMELLPALFVSTASSHQEAMVHALKQRGKHGLWGFGKCAHADFDGELKYRRGHFGIPEAALSACDDTPVYAPYATALGLLSSPHDAADALLRFQELGALGPHGFCGAVDCTSGTALIGLHDTFHQGIILMALAHVLADTPVQRYFCALPEIEACLPLLHRRQPDMVIPALRLHRRLPSEAEAEERVVDPMAEPVAERHLGTDSFRMIADSRGCSRIYDGDVPLTQHSADALHGIQFYLADEDRIFRIGDVFLPGQTVFAQGEVRLEKSCGSLKAELVCTVDTIRRRTIHILQITNLSTLDRVIEAADFLLPDLHVPADTFQPECPDAGTLVLHARCTDRSLYHTMDCAPQPLSACVCTDAAQFLGRTGSLHQPACLCEPMEDDLRPAAAACMAFRVKIAIGGRGRVTLWFTTSLESHEPPGLPELNGFRRLASLQHAAMHADAEPCPVPVAESLRTLPIPHWKAALPSPTPDMELRYPGLYGGFDPQTNDYVVLLAPGVHTPIPWTNSHLSRHFRETVSENGFDEPLQEKVWLRLEGDVLLSPWSPSLPRSIRLEAGATVWDAWSDKLDIRLCACVLPGHRFSMRVLRIRNATDAPLTLHIFVQKHFPGNERLKLLPGGVITVTPNAPSHACIGGDGWNVRRNLASNIFTDLPCLDMPDDTCGTVALLDRQLELPSHASGEALWISGFARHDEDFEKALQALTPGPSAVLRSVKTEWSRRLSRISCTTPEDTFDLLFNRILPAQALSAEGASAVRAAAYFAPADAKWRLLQAAMRAHTRDEWMELSLLASHYAEITDDAEVLEVHLPHRDAALIECCRTTLLEMPLDRSGLPLGESPAQRSLRCALAAKRLNELHPDEELAEFSRKLLLAVDTHLWKDGYYGEPLELEVQCLACEAFGANQRTQQAVMTSWNALYDRPHGLIRNHAPQNIPPLPGLPENGGMDTAHAAHCIRALIRTGHTEQAFELLRALNPMHHTDTTERQQVFKGAPCLLHGGMYASPMEPGRAVPDGSGQAAAMLYEVILKDILGLKRRGSRICLQPVVPPEWDEFTLTLQEGAATWYITLERRVKALTLDGDEQAGDEFTIRDDGKIHQVRIPLI